MSRKRRWRKTIIWLVETKYISEKMTKIYSDL